jgi:hypothetical protein
VKDHCAVDFAVMIFRSMLTNSSLFLLVALLGTASSLTCSDEPNFNVSLSLLSSYSFCPKQPITAQCIVNRNTSMGDYLDWDCDDREGSGTVICRSGNVDDFSCSYGEVNVTNRCDCTSPVIISEVTLLAPHSGGNENLYCSNGRDKKELHFATPELNTPKLIIKNDSNLYIDENHCNVTIMWTTDDSNVDDIEYVISVSNSSSPVYMNLTTTITIMNVTLQVDVNYSIVVHSLRCQGNLVSNSSNVLAANFCKAQMSANKSNTAEGMFYVLL